MRKNEYHLFAPFRALARAKAIKGLIPVSLKRLGRRLLPLEAYDPAKWLAEDPYADAEEVSTYPARVDLRLGIIREFTRIHSYYIGACRDLGVPYRVVDISGPDWIERIEGSGCDAFLVRPSGQITVWKQMVDERLRIMAQNLGRVIFPNYDEIWFYESKRRMHYWLAANQVPHPRTWVFYDRHQALTFARETDLPIVFKADFGSGSMGVRIMRERSSLNRLINRCFRRGFLKTGADRRDRQWGSVLFQEYLPDPVRGRFVLRIPEGPQGRFSQRLPPFPLRPSPDRAVASHPTGDGSGVIPEHGPGLLHHGRRSGPGQRDADDLRPPRVGRPAHGRREEGPPDLRPGPRRLAVRGGPFLQKQAL